MANYNDTLHGSIQVEAEEGIAAMIFDAEAEDAEGDPIRLPESVCQQLGRDILLAVLNQFRPDLMEDSNE
jgi:hypothetical protein